jgi:hypothetical protein
MVVELKILTNAFQGCSVTFVLLIDYGAGNKKGHTPLRITGGIPLPKDVRRRNAPKYMSTNHLSHVLQRYVVFSGKDGQYL